MTADKQHDMSGDDIVADLMEGNRRFMESKMIQRDHMAQLGQLASGQHPKAVVLSCIDSRVPVEQIFDQGVGDLFVVRVAGNIDNDHNIASLEYGCKVAGSKVIIVLGHEQCGAIKSAVKGVDMGNITELLNHMKPAIEHHRDFEGDQSVDNHDFLEIITKENAVMTLDDIRRESEILRALEDAGELKLVAAYYDLDEGKVYLVNEADYQFD
ncbi:carbonic anhydrase [bacterium]|nr:carbonic anhydrase [bacterium]